MWLFKFLLGLTPPLSNCPFILPPSVLPPNFFPALLSVYCSSCTSLKNTLTTTNLWYPTNISLATFQCKLFYCSSTWKFSVVVLNLKSFTASIVFSCWMLYPFSQKLWPASCPCWRKQLQIMMLPPLCFTKGFLSNILFYKKTKVRFGRFRPEHLLPHVCCVF